ncbi:MAG: hypothetical protein IPM82_15030 [Saprospiraceae bacterium]|nr:hypothetical protein [Saprospiraceae bacterium]
MKKILPLLLLLALQSPLFSQPETTAVMPTELPYREIPDYPESFTPENVVARTIDGVGFRFYWATEGLRPEDLAFRPTPESRSSEETIDHILGLSNLILNGIKSLPNIRSGEETSPLAFEVKRLMVLENLQTASNLLKQSGSKLEDMTIIFQNGENKTEFPFWNMLNGPIADALWHVGQVVTFRRSSGNPFNGKASVFTGRVRE